VRFDGYVDIALAGLYIARRVVVSQNDAGCLRFKGGGKTIFGLTRQSENPPVATWDMLKQGFTIQQ